MGLFERSTHGKGRASKGSSRKRRAVEENEIYIRRKADNKTVSKDRRNEVVMPQKAVDELRLQEGDRVFTGFLYGNNWGIAKWREEDAKEEDGNPGDLGVKLLKGNKFFFTLETVEDRERIVGGQPEITRPYVVTQIPGEDRKVLLMDTPPLNELQEA